MSIKNSLIFCSDCNHYIEENECSEGHDIDETTPSTCPDGIDKDSFSNVDLSKLWLSI